MNIKVSAEDASWSIREAIWDFEERYLWRSSEAARQAAWDFEERVLWKGSDAARWARWKLARRMQPLQRILETKVAWPVTDALRDAGTATRAAIATAGVAAAVAAGGTGAMMGAGPADQAAGERATLAAVPVVQAASSQATTLQGVAPQFEVGNTKVSAPAPAVPAPPVDPTAPPDKVALSFSQAFVQYEVGQVNENTATVFGATASPALAQSLATTPPRLPDGTKVPQAKVLNVVLADRTKGQVTASVSLVRLHAVSEIRLTLEHTPKGWRVAQVLG
jgi:hypothetical protein